MQYINNIADYEHATGEIPFNMTNNYMFVAVLQEDLFALKGLVASLLHRDPDEITDIFILNPIDLGVDIDLKEYILDISLTFSDNNIMNLEMQVRNQGNWVPRSISYLCREWDRIHKGDDYSTAPNAYHIGFLDFTLFEDHPEFYATYRLRNTKDGYVYSDKFTLSVVELNRINKATDEDRKYGIDKWARLFKATTWEEVKMIAANDEHISSAARSMFKREVDEATLRLCHKLEWEIAAEEKRNKRLAELEAETAKQAATITDQATTITDQAATITDQAATISDQAATISDQAATIEQLQKELAVLKIPNK